MTVFRKLQLKVMLNILLVHTLILAGLFGALNRYISLSSKSEADKFLDMLLKTEGVNVYVDQGIIRSPDSVLPFGPAVSSMPRSVDGPAPAPVSPNSSPVFSHDSILQERKSDLLSYFLPIKYDFVDFHNYFAILYNEDGSVDKVINNFRIWMPDATITFLQSDVFTECKNGQLSGIHKGLYWKAKVKRASYLVCFLDMSAEFEMQERLKSASIVICMLSLILALLFAYLLSIWTVKPVKEDFLRQKQFIADAGHELKTPIAVTGANVDVLMSLYPDNKWIGYIKTENDRMGELVKNLLYLAKSDANRLPLNLTRFDLGEVINSVVLPFESTFFEQGKLLDLQVPDEPIWVEGDVSKIKQVIIVLVDNAIKNSEKDALIRVSAINDARHGIVKVYNTGKGINPTDLPHIFERFYRSDTSRARQTGGYGLGLAIAQSIAMAHKGSLIAQSEYGKWAEFTLAIPVESTHHSFFHKE